jgi:hypothetical protein
MPREIKKWLITPASAFKVASWALRLSKESSQEDRSALIASSVFTAFMIEGVVHCIGRVLCQSWEKGKRPMALASFPKRHAAVRALMQLDNTSIGYQGIPAVIDAVFKFRNQFAHPKILLSTSTGETGKFMLTPIPQVEWESQLSHVEAGFEKLKTYSQCLLDAAASQLDVAFAHDFGHGKYPHLTNVQKEAALLRVLLRMEDFSVIGP